ncbi:leucine-rich repeat domain-containing protein [Hyunsoonleella sp. 2307UL5-6]|uniref:leucine-rich repeat domain-containing protein n=1 Tax=Hyunsoonleella sp. 2307UL5-6 TaxID=3384768 RepID=UPI0039BC42BF
MSKIIIPSINVSKLDLSNQNLTKIPTEIFSLKNLKSLDLSNNKISTIPSDILKLKQLKKLDISNNKISNFYAKICHLPKLQVLNLNNNSIKTIPKQIKHLVELRVFSIANNYLLSFPDEISELNKLLKINFSKNQFESFPESLFEIKDLKTIWLNNLKLKTFPTNLILANFKDLNAIYCFGQILDSELIHPNYVHLSKIKGNSFSELIKLNSQLNREPQEKKATMIKNNKTQTEKKKIFISYSHQDSGWLKEVKTNLKVLSYQDVDFDVWDDTKIHSGAKWKKEIEKALSECKIAILFISTDFLASDFIQNNELPPLLKKAEEDGTIILPLVVGYCRFTKDKNLKDFQAVNDPNEPLISCSKADVQKIMVKLTDDVESSLQR